MQFDKLVQQILIESSNSITEPITLQDIDNIAKKTDRVAFSCYAGVWRLFGYEHGFLKVSKQDLISFYDNLTLNTPDEDSTSRLTYSGTSYDKAIRAFDKLFLPLTFEINKPDTYKLVMDKLTAMFKNISTLPGNFKVVREEQHFIFLFEIDMVRYKMGHILDAGSEGVPDEDNILDW